MTALIGKPIRRKEDQRLVTGSGRFTDDLSFSNQAFAAILRSSHAHARILSINVTAARRAPGVLAVLTAEDYAGDGLKPLPHGPNGADHFDVSKPAFGPETMRHGSPQPQPLLAHKRVRYVGEGVALVIADSFETARDAAELIEVTYEPLPSVTGIEAALAPDAPSLWDDRPDNLLVAAEQGDRAATEAAFAGASHIVRFAGLNQRVSGAPIEPRAAIAQYDPALDRYTIHAVSQGVHRIKFTVAACLGLTPDRIRVITGDVGGGFGVRSSVYPEYPLLAWAARRVGRPVKWNSTRSEAFLADYQARDLRCEGALALDVSGRFLGLRLDYTGNLGAYAVSFAVLNNLTRMAAGVYDIPAIHVRVRGVATNTVPMSVYRGAGRPESNFVMERLVDLTAAELGLDRMELRRRNIISALALPYQSPLGHRYDNGAFAANFEAALRLIDWAEFPARERAARELGRRRGIGVANYLETPTGFVDERTDVTVLPEGRVAAVIGTQASGQGHETSFAQVVAEQLQIPLDRVEILFGDTDLAVSGAGTHSDRSMRLGGTILLRASESIIARGKKLAAHKLEAAEVDIIYEQGRFSVAGTDRSVGLFEIASYALAPSTPEPLRGPLAATEMIGVRLHAYPNGAAAAEVEIDPELGTVRLERYVTVDDVGRVINPIIVDGQIHGGAAQGIGQAVMERIVFDAATGQLVSGSFLDYAMPRAADLPSFATLRNEIPATSNPLGVKGAGEAGVTPATSAVVNAIVDALREYGVRDIAMPATPELVWRAIRAQHGREEQERGHA